MLESSFNLYFISGLGLALSMVLGWGFFTLPKEGWQMVAALPVKKCGHGRWTGLNLTWYGLLSANAYTLGVVMAVMLAASAGIPLPALVFITLVILAVTIPASKLIARMVEKKRGTFTVGGAVFAGTVSAPWVIGLANHILGHRLDVHVPAVVMMACLSIGYTFGESLGRLACLSFGCCYGKPLCECSPGVQKLFSRFHVVFTGATKKVAYASRMEGRKMIPIQMITAVIYALSGLVGIWLFLEGMAGAALMETMAVTQVWRVVSEFFRADYRGDRQFSAYQIMALMAVGGVGMMLAVSPVPAMAPVDLPTGIACLWQPGMILFVQGVWLVSFLHCGRSSVTGSRIDFHVIEENI